MIAHLKGALVSTEPTCVVDVGGVGFELHVPEKDRMSLRGTTGVVSFHTYLYVREDRLTLFGFLSGADRELFTRLIDVSGIGPKIAVKIIGENDTQQIVQAIRGADHRFLCNLHGLGRKTAERLIIELKDKLDYFTGGTTTPLPGTTTALREEAILALTTLGMQRAAAERALDGVDWAARDDSHLAAIVKEALKHAAGA